MTGVIKYPRSCPKHAKMFIEKMLSKSSQQRLGCGYDELKNHQFFNGIEWSQIVQKKAKALYVPPENTIVTEGEIEIAI
jgi:hypothetical protein